MFEIQLLIFTIDSLVRSMIDGLVERHFKTRMFPHGIRTLSERWEKSRIPMENSLNKIYCNNYFEESFQVANKNSQFLCPPENLTQNLETTQAIKTLNNVNI